jgi:hypothetical protein
MKNKLGKAVGTLVVIASIFVTLQLEEKGYVTLCKLPLVNLFTGPCPVAEDTLAPRIFELNSRTPEQMRELLDQQLNQHLDPNDLLGGKKMTPAGMPKEKTDDSRSP